MKVDTFSVYIFKLFKRKYLLRLWWNFKIKTVVFYLRRGYFIKKSLWTICLIIEQCIRECCRRKYFMRLHWFCPMNLLFINRVYRSLSIKTSRIMVWVIEFCALKKKSYILIFEIWPNIHTCDWDVLYYFPRIRPNAEGYCSSTFCFLHTKNAFFHKTIDLEMPKSNLNRLMTCQSTFRF